MAIRKTFGNKDAETPKKGQKILMDTLEKSRKANAVARGEASNTSGGTKAPKGDRAVPQRGKPAGGTRPPGGGPVRPAQKGGLPEVRRTTQPVEFKKPGTSVTEYKKPGTSVTEYKKPSTSVAEYKKPAAGGGAVRKADSLLDKAGRIAKGPIGLGGAALGFYLGDTFSSKTGNQANYGEQAWIDDKKNRGPLMKGNATADASPSKTKQRKGLGPVVYSDKAPERTTKYNSGDYAKYRKETTKDSRVADTSPANKKSDSVGGTKNGPFKSDFAKKSLQGRKPDSKPSSSVLGKSKAAPKAEKPLSNFERQKQRGYEKEGYGGRSMSSKGAESRVKKERGYKFKDLFKKK